MKLATGVVAVAGRSGWISDWPCQQRIHLEYQPSTSILPLSKKKLSAPWSTGQLPLTIRLAVTPFSNRTHAHEFTSTARFLRSTHAKTSSTFDSTDQQRLVSRCAPLSYTWPPPESTGSCRQVPVV